MYALCDRAKAVEDQFTRDQSLRFRAGTRRNGLMGPRIARLLTVPMQAPTPVIWDFNPRRQGSAGISHQIAS
ncbi:ATPase inhibitor subunit zeta [Neorhizobium galegae]|uniref:ATPase inhibitor subunit zeta n=1 Tax=Neorhizobium galegae TaxID=399 RepID=UPI00351CBCC9